MLLLTTLCLSLSLGQPAVQEDSVAESSAAPAPVLLDGGVFGRVLLPGGAPAVDVPLTLSGDVSNSITTVKRAYRGPDSWEDQVVRTDAEGRFRFEFDRHPSVSFQIEGELDGYARLILDLSTFAPDVRHASTDLGDVVFEPAQTLNGRVVNFLGDVLAVPVHLAAVGPGGYRPFGGQYRDSVPVDPETGAFVFDDLPAGKMRLTVIPSLGLSVSGPSVELPRESADPLLIEVPGGREGLIDLWAIPVRSGHLGNRCVRAPG